MLSWPSAEDDFVHGVIVIPAVVRVPLLLQLLVAVFLNESLSLAPSFDRSDADVTIDVPPKLD